MSGLAAFSTTAMPLPPAANGASDRRIRADAGGALLLGVPVARGAALLFGWHGASLPRQGVALVEHAAGRLRGAFRLHAWRRDEAGTAWFLAALQLREPDALPADARLSLRHGERPELLIGPLPRAATSPAALAERLAAEAGQAPGPIALFLADLCAAAPRSAALRTLLGGFLRQAAEEDGVVEIVGHAHETLMLQGWGRGDPAEGAVALLGDGPISRHAVSLAAFARPDIAPPAGGIVALVHGAAGCDPRAPAAVHLISGPTLLRRPVLPTRQLLDAAQTAGHLRDVLGQLACTAETRAELRRLLRPVFSGEDTLSGFARPVRAAVDLAMFFPGAGVFLAGWMVDAQRETRAVSLCAGNGLVRRLDEAWTRLPRPDVAEAFRADPRFAPLHAGPPLHGFACFVPHTSGGAVPAGAHLELAIGETLAFLPLSLSEGGPRAGLLRALEAVDLYQDGAHAAIAAQLGPLVQAVLRAARELAPAETVRVARTTPTCALLLPLPASGPAHLALSFLLADPLTAEEGLVLIAPASWGERDLAALQRALPLYAPDATVLRAAEPACWTELLELGARASGAEAFLCLGGGVVGRSPGWRAALARGAGAAVRFPTALYEDEAVRSLGVTGVEKLAQPPWARLVRPGAGMPAAAVSGAGAELVGGSLAGALVPRAAWRAAGGFAGGGLMAAAQELAFFRRLAAAGGAFTHSSQLAVYVVDDAPAGPPPRWQQAARLVDGWLLAAEKERS